MGKQDVDIAEEEAAFAKEVEQIEAWWKTPRHAALKRPYSAHRVAALRSSERVDYVSSRQALKLWRLLQEHRAEATYELTFGITDPALSSDVAKYQDTVYVSGALCSATASLHPGIDHADYPWDTVPKVVSRIRHMQEWNDQRQRQHRLSIPVQQRAALPYYDYLLPIIADGDMGFGPLTATMKMAAAFVEAGAAMIHVDDLAMGMKKFTIGQGRTLVPVCEYEQRLCAVRLQFDIMGADTLLLLRSDCIKAEFITSVVDPRDHAYVLGATNLDVEPFSEAQKRAIEQGELNTTTTRRQWAQTARLKTFDEAVKDICSSDALYDRYVSALPTVASLAQRRRIAAEILGPETEIPFDWELPRSVQGQYMYRWCVQAVIDRQLAAAPYGDVSWPRMDFPDTALVAEIHAAVTKHYPNRLFCYGYSNACDWAAYGFSSSEDIAAFPSTMAKHGAVFQIQPVGGFQRMRAYMANCCKLLKEEGLAGYVRTRGEGEPDMVDMGAHFADALIETVLARDGSL